MSKNIMILPVTADQLEDELVGLLDEVTIRNDYSGRAMYGETCFGIVTDQTDMVVGMALGGALNVFDIDPYDVVCRARSDNMGYDRIVYFPGFRLAE